MTANYLLITFGYFHVLYRLAFSNELLIGVVNNSSSNDKAVASNIFLSQQHTLPNETTKEIIKKMLTRKCSYDYSTACFKMDVVKFVSRLGKQSNYQLLPGIALIRSSVVTTTNSDQLEDMPTEIAMSVVRNNSSKELDNYLYSKMDSYLNSLSVKVNLLENPLVNGLKTIGGNLIRNMLASSLTASTSSGRSKKGHGHKDMSAAIWSAATMGALGFAGLAAMSGKALMTATVALLLSIMCLLKGCGHGHGKSSHYEIITKPAHLHDVDHVHSLSNSPYGYARHFVEQTVVPTDFNLFDSGETDETRNVESKVVPIRTVRLQPVARTYVPSSLPSSSSEVVDQIAHDENDDDRYA